MNCDVLLRLVERILPVVIALFPLSEIALAFKKRSRQGSARSEDRGSMRLLWLSIVVGVVLAAGLSSVPMGRLSLSPSILQPVALILLVGGLAVRWAAVITLGRFFTVDVAIHPEHAVVQHGLYRYMRHPSYTGLLVAFMGLGVYFANWLSIVALLTPATIGVIHRVRHEERVLLDSLGPAYADYCSRTKRFIPGLL